MPGEDIFKLDKIFFPCNINNNHWCLVVAFMQEKRIQFYDSSGRDGMNYLEGIMNYLKDEWRAKKDSQLPESDRWKLVNNTDDTPQQENDFDYGVFICMFAEILSYGRPLSFSQHDVTRLRCRERIALSIMNGGDY